MSGEFESGAGGLVSTADDLLVFGRMLLPDGGGERLLSRPTLELMATDQLTPIQKARSPFFDGFWDSRGWGLGLGVVTTRTDVAEVPGRYGWDGAFGTSCYVDAREGLVDWTAALGLGVAGSVFAIVGALTSDHVGGGALMVLTAALMLWSGFSVVRGGRRAAAGPGEEGTPAVDLVAPEEDEGLLGEAFEGTEASETDTAFALSREEVVIGTSS